MCVFEFVFVYVSARMCVGSLRRGVGCGRRTLVCVCVCLCLCACLSLCLFRMCWVLFVKVILKV